MASINIDGRLFNGADVTIRNGSVYIDGKLQEGELSGIVEIRILEGVIERLQSDSSISCGAVAGDVSAGGSVSAGNVGGKIVAGGSVACENVGGPVSCGRSFRRQQGCAE